MKLKTFRNGDEWWKIRSKLQKGISSPKNVRDFLPRADEAVKDFVRTLPQQFNGQSEIPEMLDEVSRLSLELVCLLAFDERLDSFSESERRPESKSSKLIRASEETNRITLPTDQGYQLWRFFETSDYRKLRQSQEFMEQVAIELVAAKASRVRSEVEALKE